METEFYPEYFRLEGRHWWFIGRRKILLAVLDRELGGRHGDLQILDFGCGTGAFHEHLASYGEVRGVDDDRAAVDFCRQRGVAAVTHVSSGAPLPFPDASFDVVTTLDVIEHIEDDGGALRELRRVLKPSGLLLVAVPAFMFLWGDQDEISHHYRRYRAPELRARLRDAGFAVGKTSYFNSLLFPFIALVRVVRRRLRKPRADRTDFSMGAPWLNTPLGWVLGLEAGPVARWRLPFGVSLLAIARAQ